MLDTLETLLSGDFRFHFRNHTFKYIINLMNKINNFDRLNNILGMDPYNDEIISMRYPVDYSMVIKDYYAFIHNAEKILLKNSIVLDDFNE